MILPIQPALALVWGWWILDQSLAPGRLVGALLVLAGIVLALVPEVLRARRAQSKLSR